MNPFRAFMRGMGRTDLYFHAAFGVILVAGFVFVAPLVDNVWHHLNRGVRSSHPPQDRSMHVPTRKWCSEMGNHAIAASSLQQCLMSSVCPRRNCSKTSGRTAVRVQDRYVCRAYSNTV